MVKVAVVQDGTVIYNQTQTLQKVRDRTKEAAEKGAQLVLFPEAFVGGYLKGLDFGIRMGMRSDSGRDEFVQYFKHAIEYEGPESDELAEIAAENGVVLVIGVVEREGSTLYCSVFVYSESGARLGKHRKLMPTALERCVWGQGDGSTIAAIPSSLGQLGLAICWENYMPLLRVSLYRDGVQLYLAPTVDDRDVWLPTMTAIALEGRCFVVSACQMLTAADFPARHAAHGPADQVLIRGGSCVVGPLGQVLLKPTFGQRLVQVVDLDLDLITKGKFDLDTVGHYDRPDIFQLTINKPQLKH